MSAPLPSLIPKPTPPRTRSAQQRPPSKLPVTAALRYDLVNVTAKLTAAQQKLTELADVNEQLTAAQQKLSDLADVSEQLTAVQERLSGLEQRRLEAVTPPHLRCPITLQRMCSPVIVTDGHTFERRSIEEWLQRHNTNPLTGTVLPGRALVSSLALRDAIRAWEMEHGRSPTPRPSPRQPLFGGEESEVEGGEDEETGDVDALEEENAVATPRPLTELVWRARMESIVAPYGTAIRALEGQGNAFASDVASALSALSARQLARAVSSSPYI